MVDRSRMEAQLVLHEGLRLAPYLDTEGYQTIGVGYNLTSRGPGFLERAIGRPLSATGGKITRDEALTVLRADIAALEPVVARDWPPYATLDEVRQRVVLDLAFNLGHHALGFHKAAGAMASHNWSVAARELYKSHWAYQVGDGEGGRFDRADRLARMVLTGQDYTQ